MRKYAISVVALVTLSSLANTMWRSFGLSTMMWVTLLVCITCCVLSGIMATGSKGMERYLAFYMVVFSLLKAVTLCLVVMDVPGALLFLVIHDLATLYVVGLAGAFLTPVRLPQATRPMMAVVIQYKLVVILGTLTTAMGENAWLGRIHFDLMEWIPWAHAIIASAFLATLVVACRRFPYLLVVQIVLFLTGALNLINSDLAAISHSVITPAATAILCYYIVIKPPVKKTYGKVVPNPHPIWS